jgi:SAM-dependent methyltransferase
MKLAEACELLYLHFAVRAYEWLEQKRVRKQFYQDPLYKALDLALMKGPNPYRNKEAFPYGETPLCSLKKIADRFGLKSSDKVVDLGCGRGRGVFFLAQHYRCEVTGIDLVEPFIERARRFAKECQRLIPRSAEKVPFGLMRKLPRLDDRKASCVKLIQRYSLYDFFVAKF